MNIQYPFGIPVMGSLVPWNNWRMDRQLIQLDIYKRLDYFVQSIQLWVHMDSLPRKGLCPFEALRMEYNVLEVRRKTERAEGIFGFYKF